MKVPVAREDIARRRENQTGTKYVDVEVSMACHSVSKESGAWP